MENVDIAVLRELRDWMKGGHAAALVTVVSTWGSSPRPVGSIMAMRDDGCVAGSVSGGCIEEDLITRLAIPSTGGLRVEHVPRRRPPEFLTYGVTADEAHRFGLPCGGTMRLLLEFQPDLNTTARLVSDLEKGQLMQRVTHLSDGTVELVPTPPAAGLSVTGSVVANTFGPEWRLLVIGGGQLSACVASIATMSGFAVTVCEPRSEYRAGWDVGGVKVVTDMPDDAVAAFMLDRRSCVVALTHDPKLDDLALLEALRSEAFYVGAIGSRRNCEARRKRFIEHFGQTERSLARLHGPIGIYIGSKTPPEIAVSTMAQVLAAKNEVELPPRLSVESAKERLDTAGRRKALAS